MPSPSDVPAFPPTPCAPKSSLTWFPTRLTIPAVRVLATACVPDVPPKNSRIRALAVPTEATACDNPSVSPRFGNLLTLPVAGGMLYVEPIYIQRKDANAFPQLARVLVSFGNKVGFEATINAALEKVLGAGAGQPATQPGQNPTTTPPTSTTPPTTTTPPPNTGGGGGGTSGELDSAVQALNAALEHLRSAQRSGDFTEQGKALAELDAAGKAYEEAKNKLSTSSAPSSPGASPSPTPTAGG